MNNQEGSYAMEDKLIPITQVMDRVGLKRTSIYRKLDKGEFPKPISLGRKAVRWSNNAISAWIDNQVNQPSM